MNKTGFSSIDRPWLDFYGNDVLGVKNPECCFYEYIYKENKAFPNEIAFLYYGNKITFGQLFEKVDEAARAYIKLGVKNNDEVLFLSVATLEAMYSIFALNKIGANVVLLNPTNTEEQLLYRIKQAEYKYAFVVSELYDKIKNILEKNPIENVVTSSVLNSMSLVKKVIKGAKHIKGTVSWNDFIKNGNVEKFAVPFCKYSKDKPAVVICSSGTTGVPKGIQHTNDSVNSIVVNEKYVDYNWVRQKTSMAHIPIWFGTGLIVLIIAPLVNGFKILLEPIFDFELIYKQVLKYKPELIISAPGLVFKILKEKKKKKAFANFYNLIIGGEGVTVQTEKRINDFLKANGNNNVVCKGYGMCECGGTVCTTGQNTNHLMSAGLPLPQVIISAFDINTGKELKYNEHGEIRISTPGAMSFYYHNEAATNEYFSVDENGRKWCHTGDMGYISPEGHVYILGRISNSYKTESGNTIYLFDIERIISELDFVFQCKVVFNKDRIPVVHLRVLCDEKTALDEIIKYCKEKLSVEAQPHFFRFYEDTLPFAISGKTDVALLVQNDYTIQI